MLNGMMVTCDILLDAYDISPKLKYLKNNPKMSGHGKNVCYRSICKQVRDTHERQDKMTAKIVRHHTRCSIEYVEMHCAYYMRNDGDITACLRRYNAIVPGQLWERVGEMGESGVVNSPNYTPTIADAYKRVQDVYGRDGVGPLASGNPWAKSGVIVAGRNRALWQ
jgi:hypothetical protein